MNEQQLQKMKNDDGFIAALDQSGGSTPKALLAYGVGEDEYSGDDEMFGETMAPDSLSSMLGLTGATDTADATDIDPATDVDGAANEFVANLNLGYWNADIRILWFTISTDPTDQVERSFNK